MATSAKQWKKSNKGTHDVELPSGNICRARRPGMEMFLEAGILPNSLAGIVQDAISGKVDPEDPKMQAEIDQKLTEMMSGENGLAQIINVADAVCCFILVEPKLHPVPESEEDREDDLLYVDEVELPDKLHLFNWAVGGADGLAPFREGQGGNVGKSRAGKNVRVPPKRPAGSGRR